MLCLVFAVTAAAQPRPDALFIPTPVAVAERMLEIAEVGTDELVLDLGSGDGRIPILAAERFGAFGMGVEIDPELVEHSWLAARRAGVADRVVFMTGDMFETDFGQPDVVALYLSRELNVRLRPRLQMLKPGTRVVSHDFDMGDWPPDHHEVFRHRDLYLWIVPARVAGDWRIDGLEAPVELSLRQTHQQLSGQGRIGGQAAELVGARLRGDRIHLELLIGDRRLSLDGRVRGDDLQPVDGTAWQGVRLAR
jgi:SAM-dependent methyltransferase